MKIADYILLAIIAALFIAAVVRTVRRGACPCGTCKSCGVCKTAERKNANSGCTECSETNGVGCAECGKTNCAECSDRYGSHKNTDN